MTKNKAILFLSSDEFYPQFEVALDSVFKHCPEADVWLLYFSTDPNVVGKEHDPRIAKVLRVDTFAHDLKDDLIPIPNRSYPIADFIASHRAAFILKALHEYKEVMLLGSDCVVYDSLELLWDALLYHNAVLTPHITEFLPEDGKYPKNEDFLHVGQMNVDVMLFRDCPEVSRFLSWVHQKLQTDCVRDKSRNIFSDQTWFNFAFSLLPRTLALQASNYNVAYWNVYQRGGISYNPTTNTWFVCGAYQLRIFQFSGMSWDDPAQMSTHQNRYRAEGDLLKLYTGYVEAVNAKRS